MAMLDLSSSGARALIALTNSQFEFWANAVRDAAEKAGTTESIKPGSLMDFWFIMSNLALQPRFALVKKKEAYETIPGLAEDTVRRYIGDAEKLGLVETVASKGNREVRLTETGQHAVASTLARWVSEFGKIQREHFDSQSGPQKSERKKPRSEKRSG